MRKEGISLIALVITMLVMAILASALLMKLDNSISSAQEVGFANELKEISEGAKVYYLLNKELPVIKNTSYSKTELLTMSGNATELQNEITLNQDMSTVYYKIDMNLIAKSDGLYGNETSTYDFYVISEDGNFVYYPLGIKIEDDIYFSLTSKLSQITDVTIGSGVSGDVASVTSSAKISVTKSTNEWTNSLSLTVSTTLNNGDTLYYIVNDTKTQITSDLPYTLIFSNSSTGLEDATEVVFQKENSSNKVIAKSVVDISNLDITAPTVGTPVVQKYTDYTVVEFTGAHDDKSQIEYSYYTTSKTTYTAEQIVAIDAQSGAYSIILSSDATYVQFVLVDKAGNISEIKKVTIE